MPYQYKQIGNRMIDIEYHHDGPFHDKVHLPRPNTQRLILLEDSQNLTVK